MANSRDFTGKNRKFTGTKGIVPPKGTTGERVGSESGEFRFNTTTELMEYYDGNQWKPIDAPPSISTITTSDAQGTNNILNADGSTLHTITINGGNFGIGAVVKFIGSTGTEYTAGNVTRVSGSQITCTTLISMGTADDPYDILVTNASGLSATLEDAFSYNAPPVFTVASGQLGTVYNTQVISGTTFNAGATDAEGNTITYSIVSGSLPGSGLTLSSSTGAITGTLSGSPSLGNYPFVVRASTTEGVRERQFSIQVVANPYIVATGGTVTSSGGYTIHTFTSSGNLVVSSAGTSPTNNLQYLVIAGGGGGGGSISGGGGAGGYRTNVPGQTSGGGGSAEATFTPTATTYNVTVGAGGPGGTDGSSGAVSQGENSVFSTITSLGGGSSAAYSGTGFAGGSGGGGARGGPGGPIQAGGAGTANQGRAGGSGSNSGGSDNHGSGGGGGGASSAGGDASGGTAGSGGAGVSSNINGSATTRAGGGGGGAYNGTPGSGGSGGGGAGSGSPQTPGAGDQYTGSGGGAAGYPSNRTGGLGGSGIVIIRYLAS